MMGKRMGNALYAWHPIKSAADLPQESGEYLVTIYDVPANAHYVRIAYYDAKVPMWIEGDRQIWWSVLAWRPLPKPYEGEA